MRPRWHRWTGWLGVLGGVAVIIANDAMFFVEGTLLPGGHNELYLLLGLAVAGAFTWFLGFFDRGQTVFD